MGESVEDRWETGGRDGTSYEADLSDPHGAVRAQGVGISVATKTRQPTTTSRGTMGGNGRRRRLNTKHEASA